MPQEDGTVKVEGIASSEATDDQGEIVQAAAMRAAIPDYMRFPALREMHQLSAAGTTLQAEVGDDGITRIFAHVVDPVAVTKVKTKVYRGFSIGGQVTDRDTANRKVITGIKLSEISLVDRPANPDAILDCWKASDIEGTNDMADGGLATIGDLVAAAELKPATAATAPHTADGVRQRWLANDNSEHVTKAAAVARNTEIEAAGDKEVDAGAENAAEIADATEKAAASPAERATEAEAAAGTDDAAEIEKYAQEGADAAQAAIDAAMKAIERGEVALAEPAEVLPEDDRSQLSEEGSRLSEEGSCLSEETADAAEKATGDAATDAESSEPARKDGDSSKPYGDVKYADPGYQADGKKRYPIDTAAHIRAAWNYINKPKNAGKYSSEHAASIKSRIVAAWKDKIDSDGPPSAKKASRAELAKSIWDIGQIAMMVEQMRALEQSLEIESAMEGDDSSLPAKAHEACTVLCEFLNQCVAEETAEILEGEEIDEPVGTGMDQIFMSALTACLIKAISDPDKAAALVTKVEKAGARLNRTDNMHLNHALHYAEEAMGMDGVTQAEMIHFGEVHKAALDAGATNIAAPPSAPPPRNATQDTGHNGQKSVPQGSGGAVPASPMPKAATAVMFKALARAADLPEGDEVLANADTALKAGVKPQHILAGMIHDCMKAVSDGATCKAGGAAPTRHSGTTMAHFHKAHFHIGQVTGGACKDAAANAIPGGAPSADGEQEHQGATSSAKAVTPAGTEADDRLAKAEAALSAKTAQSDELAKALAGVVPMLERLSKRVEDIAQTPIPPQAVVRVDGTAAVTKAQDGRAVNGGDELELSPAQLAAALGKKSKEEQTLIMIKASHAHPFRLDPSRMGVQGPQG